VEGSAEEVALGDEEASRNPEAWFAARRFARASAERPVDRFSRNRSDAH
jgi:hypothetical protein